MSDLFDLAFPDEKIPEYLSTYSDTSHTRCPNKECDGVWEDRVINDENSALCEKCGTIWSSASLPTEGAEWCSFYEDASKGEQLQRCDTSTNGFYNPYETQGTMISYGLKFQYRNETGKMVVCDMSKYHNKQVYSSKERSYYLLCQELDRIGMENNIPTNAMAIAKNMWEKITNGGTLTRGGNRQSLMACCIYYALIYTGNHTITRSAIKNMFKFERNELSSGDKLFREIFQSDPVYSQVVLQDNSSNVAVFGRFLDMLDLTFVHERDCERIYPIVFPYMEGMNPRSIISGVIVYVVHDLHKLKAPSIQTICQTVDVCQPTMNKTLVMIRKIMIKHTTTSNQCNPGSSHTDSHV